MYLLEIIDEKNAYGIPRVRLLPGQYLNGELIDSSLRVQTRTSGLRTEGNVGMVLEVDSLELTQTPAGAKYYRTTDDLVIHKDLKTN